MGLWMNAQSSRFARAILSGSRTAIGSQALRAGRVLSNSLSGRQTDPYGQRACPANHSPTLDNDMQKKMNGISGQPSPR